MNAATISRRELDDLQARALPILKLTDALDPADVISGTVAFADPKLSELQAAVDAARKVADGDSNDPEIQALQEALELALTRWPEITQPE